MNAKMSQHLTLLGLCSLVFYGVMLGTGKLSIEMMPQFVISAIIFLMSGRIMRKAAKAMASDDEDISEKKKVQLNLDWPWLTTLLNWTATLLIIGTLSVFLMKPIGISPSKALKISLAPEQFYAHVIP